MQPQNIPDDTKAMQELYRVLKPGGMATNSARLKSRRYFCWWYYYRSKNVLKSLVSTTMYAFMDEIILTTKHRFYSSRRRLYHKIALN
jgi:ubiquinone/menaquinone biosynthesis C-methylase UbiE